jgi:hypothetical protein
MLMKQQAVVLLMYIMMYYDLYQAKVLAYCCHLSMIGSISSLKCGAQFNNCLQPRHLTFSYLTESPFLDRPCLL